MNSRKCSISAALLFAAALCCAGAAQAEEQPHGKPFYQPGQGYEQEPEYKFSGLIRQLPADGTVGSWIVDDRQIVVTPLTVLKEEQGKAAAGTTVEVKGVLKGISFIATEIEVKAAAKP
ncbi:MAG: DUF5666 domain-containing protein [Candidatus Electronema sp. VV]